ncbi:serine O-acetyltransferase [Microcoleus sp.]|uniref:serine O-acetyltransferase n=1 Tax=Microcoleus sp. TaxID=44472 RepID=UPI00352388A9
MLKTLRADFSIIFDRDPAARNWLEVLFCYPGLQALVFHRIAHWLYLVGIPFIPRLMSHLARFFTGIEIHPGATIGKSVFIDHGMGVVIGETAIVGDFALIYQGVTLGGTGKESGKRHPTVGENVVIGAGAKVLGNLQIGNNVRIGAGSVVLRDVPSDCTVVGIPGRIVYRSGVRVNPLEHGSLPDSEAVVIRSLVDRIESLEQQLKSLQTQQPVSFKSEPNSHNFHSTFPTLHQTTNLALAETTKLAVASTCQLKDKAIQEFFDGSGI